jgi:drug/metabolite transporter (DMT)-like permease
MSAAKERPCYRTSPVESAPIKQASVEVAAPRGSARPPSPSSPIAGMLWMLLASTFFSMMNVTVRLGSAHLPWVEVASARAVIAVVVTVSIAAWRGASLEIHDRRLSWVRSLSGTAAMFCSFYAMGAPSIALGDVVALTSTSPIFVAMLSPALLRERSGWRVWGATSISFVGVILVVGPSFHLAGAIAAMAMLGGFFSALAMIWLRKLGASEKKESPEAIVAHFSMVAAAAMTLCALPTLKLPDLKGGVLLAATGILGAFGQLSLTRAYALDQAARLGAVGYIAIVLTHLFGSVAFGEMPGVPAAIGAALIIGAGLLLALSTMRDGRVIAADA